jgi:hypothetical protein
MYGDIERLGFACQATTMLNGFLLGVVLHVFLSLGTDRVKSMVRGSGIGRQGCFDGMGTVQQIALGGLGRH